MSVLSDNYQINKRAIRFMNVVYINIIMILGVNPEIYNDILRQITHLTRTMTHFYLERLKKISGRCSKMVLLADLRLKMRNKTSCQSVPRILSRQE